MHIASERGVKIISALGLSCLVAGIGTFILVTGAVTIRASAAMTALIGLLLVMWGNNLQAKIGKDSNA